MDEEERHEAGGAGVLKVKEVAAVLRISPKLVYELIERGELSAFQPGKRHYRILATEFEAYKRRAATASRSADGAGGVAPTGERR